MIDIINTASGLLTALFAAGALLQLGLMKKQMHRDFEVQYLSRFWDLSDRFSDKFMTGRGMSKSDRIILVHYFTLTEDQIGLRELGRISNDTWNFWKRDIRLFCNREYVKEELKHTGVWDYPRLKELLKDETYDPITIGKFKRFFYGL